MAVKRCIQMAVIKNRTDRKLKPTSNTQKKIWQLDGPNKTRSIYHRIEVCVL